MAIETIVEDEKTTFLIHEATRFGQADDHRKVVVPHLRTDIDKLPTITNEQISALPNDIVGSGIVERVESRHQLPTGDVLVFIHREDHSDWDSNTYRIDAYSIEGPYRFVKLS